MLTQTLLLWALLRFLTDYNIVLLAMISCVVHVIVYPMCWEAWMVYAGPVLFAAPTLLVFPVLSSLVSRHFPDTEQVRPHVLPAQ